MPAVKIGEDKEEDDHEEESLDATVVDTEEVNVHDKLLWGYACFIHRFMHVKWVQDHAHKDGLEVTSTDTKASVIFFFNTTYNVDPINRSGLFQALR